MNRICYNYLLEWKKEKNRKPLLLRGARQVGKTFLARELGKTFSNYIEVNFELTPDIKKVFERDLDPSRIIKELSLIRKVRITPSDTLLFLDEVQDAPKALASLRYFNELMPDLHVIAAGSLIEFVLEEIGLPVGRITSLYLYPLSFLEFLKAGGNESLVAEILRHNPENEMAIAVHDQLLNILGEYLAVGGMPEAVKKWLEERDYNACTAVLRRLCESYRQDFSKYAKKYQIKYVSLLFDSVPFMSGQQFRFSRVPGGYRKRELEPALDLLIKAGVVHRVVSSSGQGIPLGAQADPDTFKALFLDVALSQTVLGADASPWLLDPAAAIINKGAIIESFVGQELLAYSAPDMKAGLYYWHRESPSSSAEVDYLVKQQQYVVPVEVKSGTTGRLTSVRLFLESHANSPMAYRLWGGNYNVYQRIRTCPLYAVASISESYFSKES
jgi:uncharacterized protein